MEYAKRETAALAHVDDSYYYGAYCRKCKHSARLSLTKLRTYLGDDFSLVKVKDRLRCKRCGSRQIVVTFLAPNQRTGNLAHLSARSNVKSNSSDYGAIITLDNVSSTTLATTFSEP
jgi:hypothetical protein